MKVLTFARYTIFRNLRDIKLMLALTVFPLVAILIMGTALGSGSGTIGSDRIKVAYYSSDKDEAAKQFDNFLHSKQVEDTFEIRNVTSLKEGMNLVESEDAGAFIYIADNFSENLKGGKKAEISIFSGTETPTEKILVGSFTDAYNSMSTALKMGGSLGHSNSSGLIERKGLNVDSIDINSVTTLFLFLFFGTVLGSFSISKDVNSNIHKRIKCTPVLWVEEIAGKVLGNTLTLLLIALIIISFSAAAYGTNWNGSIDLMLLVIILFGIMSTSIGMISFYITHNTIASTIISVVLAFSSSLISMIPSAKTIWHLSPSFYAQGIFYDSIYGGTAQSISSAVITLAVFAAAVFIAALVTGRRRRLV